MERQGTHVARLVAAVLATFLVALPTAAQSRSPAAETTTKETAAVEPVTRLEVTVRDDGGEPLEGALVVARPSSGGYLPFGGLDPEKTRATVANSEGRAKLESLPTGPWTVTVQARGFAPKTERRVEVGPLEVRLDRGGVITGVVADAEGVPLPGARVSLGTRLALPSAWATEASRVETTTDAEGRFRLEGIGARPVTVAARAPGYGRATRADVEAGAHVELFLFPGATLSGTVVDGEGRPIEAALVQAVGSGPWPTLLPSERTDAGGHFVMAGAEEGEYVVMAREGGRAPGLGRAVVEGDAETSVEIMLTEGGYVTGRLVDVDGQPLEGHAEAMVFEDLGLPDFFRDRFSADARSGGTFVLGPLPIGDFEIAVSVPGYTPGRRREAWVADDGATVDLGDVVLDRGLAIRGRVVDEEGLAVEGARVRARAQSLGMTTRVPETDSGAEGRFEVSGLGEGPWEVQASAPGFADGSVPARAGDEGLELTLKAGGKITGRVVDVEGQPVPEARIHAEPAERSPQRRPARGVYAGAEDEDGRFVLRDVATGTWVLEASASGKGEASVSGLRVTGGRTTDVGTVRLARGGAIRGTVVDSDGSGIPGATVQAERDVHARTGRHRTQSGSGGAFELRGVPAGRLAVFAHHPSFAPGPAEIVEVDPQVEPVPTRLVLSRGGRIEGFALHRDGRPFDGGQIMAWGLGVNSGPSGTGATPVGPDGWFSVDHVPPGRTRVHLMAYTPSSPLASGPAPNILTGVATKEVEVKEGETASLDFQLRDVIVAGQVTRAQQPTPGIRVGLMGRGSSLSTFMGPTAPRAVGGAGPPPLTATTREDGRYELMVYTPGHFYVQLREQAGGQSFPGREVDVPDVEHFELDLEIGDAPVVGVLVDAESGEPVAEGGVRLKRAGSGSGWAGGASAGPDGRFRFAVETGEYHLSAQAPGRKAVSMDITVGPSGLADLRIEMKRGLEIAGRVIDASGRPTGGILVAANDAEGRWSGAAQTLPDGTFRLGSLDEQAYTLAAGAGLAGFAIHPGVRPGEEPVVLRLKPGGRVALRVLDAAGAPVRDAWPQVRAVGGLRVNMPDLQSSSTDPAGRTEMTVPAGRVEVETFLEKAHGSGTVTVPEGETVPLEIVLQPNDS